MEYLNLAPDEVEEEQEGGMIDVQLLDALVAQALAPSQPVVALGTF